MCAILQPGIVKAYDLFRDQFESRALPVNETVVGFFTCFLQLPLYDWILTCYNGFNGD